MHCKPAMQAKGSKKQTGIIFSAMADNVSSAKPQPDVARVLVANEPRAYREVTAEVLGQLRPDVEFLLVEPGGLESEISRLTPDMVLCDEATPKVRSEVITWLELYPHGDTTSVFGTGDEHSTIENIQLSDILTLVDRTIKHKI